MNFLEFQNELEKLIPFILGILMYSMFVQIPFAALKETFSNRRFFYALCIVNFIAVPIVVWTLTLFLPDYPPLLLGVYLVLLTPCIDYVIVFTMLGKGNEKAMLSATPFLFCCTSTVTAVLFMVVYRRTSGKYSRSGSIF